LKHRQVVVLTVQSAASVTISVKHTLKCAQNKINRDTKSTQNQLINQSQIYYFQNSHTKQCENITVNQSMSEFPKSSLKQHKKKPLSMVY